MTRTRITLAALLLAGIAAPAFAAPSSQEFVTKAALTDKFEIASSKLALHKSSDPDIQAFAKQMIADHHQSTAGLKAALAQSGTGIKPPVALDSKHHELLSKLRNDSGDDFDHDYLAAQEEGHDKAVDLFTAYSQGGHNAALKSFAAQTLPVIQHHQQMAHDLAQNH